MDELGNFGHVNVPIIEGPGHCLRLKNGAFFSITIGSANLPYDELFYKFLLFQNAQYCTTFGRFHWFFLFCPFFFLRVTYLLLGFTGGLFVITLDRS